MRDRSRGGALGVATLVTCTRSRVDLHVHVVDLSIFRLTVQMQTETYMYLWEKKRNDDDGSTRMGGRPRLSLDGAWAVRGTVTQCFRDAALTSRRDRRNLQKRRPSTIAFHTFPTPCVLHHLICASATIYVGSRVSAAAAAAGNRQ